MSVAEIKIANLYGGEMSVAEMIIADSCDLMMWFGPFLIEMTCADTPSFVESYRMSPGPFLMYVNCLVASEIDEVEDLIGADC